MREMYFMWLLMLWMGASRTLRGIKTKRSRIGKKRGQSRTRSNYDEPADWYYPVPESLGAALSAGNATEAEQVFREDLMRNRRNPGLYSA
jgi:hypothetical protein